MHEILVPTLNNNDTEAKLLRWLVADGAAVAAGAAVAEVETSKATDEVTSEAAGLLCRLVAEGATVPFGAPIARVFADAGERDAAAGSAMPPAPGAAAAPGAGEWGDFGDLVLTPSARRLAVQLRLTAAQLRALGEPVIRREHLAAFAAPGETTAAPAVPSAPPAAPSAASVLPTTVAVALPPGAVPLSAHQLAVARLVSRAHQEIPAAYTAMRVPCDALLDALAAYGRAARAMVGVPEYLIRVLGRLRGEFPAFYATVAGGTHLVPAAAANIGVTLDLGQGLFIPVLREPGALPLREVARRLMALRLAARRGSFHSDDLRGGTISLSINAEEGIVLVAPIIQTPQTAMLALGAVHAEAVVAADGQVRAQRCVYLGVSYDHRAINGADAGRFLGAIRQAFLAPDTGDPAAPA